MSVLRRRRVTDHVEVDADGTWAISYGDMVTLLLTFFILFFSTDKHRDRMQAMETTLLAKLEAVSLPDPPPGSVGQDPHFDPKTANLMAAKVHKIGQKLIVEFPNTSFFNFGKVDVNAKGQKELERFVSTYMPYAGNYIVAIRAYTDNKRVRANSNPKFSDNLELSALRSVAAMRVMQRLGIPLHRMRLGGYGELRLTAEELTRAIASTPSYSRSGLALARKLVLVIEPEPKESL